MRNTMIWIGLVCDGDLVKREVIAMEISKMFTLKDAIRDYEALERQNQLPGTATDL